MKKKVLAVLLTCALMFGAVGVVYANADFGYIPAATTNNGPPQSWNGGGGPTPTPRPQPVPQPPGAPIIMPSSCPVTDADR